MDSSVRAVMEVKIEPSWREALQGEFDSPYFAELVRFVRAAYARGTVYPPGRLIFEAFNRTPIDKHLSILDLVL